MKIDFAFELTRTVATEKENKKGFIIIVLVVLLITKQKCINLMHIKFILV